MLIIDRIKALCDEKGIKQKYLFNQIGKDRTLFANWERGKSKPTDEILAKIANILDTTPEYLRGETDIKAKSPLLQKIEQKRKTSCLILNYHSETGEPEIIDIAPENMEKVKEYIRLLNNDKKD